MLAMLEEPKRNEAIPADPPEEPITPADAVEGTPFSRPDFSCGKRSYPTKRDAQCMRNHILRGKRRKQRPRNLRIYHCCRCDQWHLTSVRPRKKPTVPKVTLKKPKCEPPVPDDMAA